MFDGILVKFGLQAYASLIRLCVVILAISGLFGSGYVMGLRHEKIVIQTKVVKSITTQIKNMPGEDKRVLKTIGGVLKIHDTVVLDTLPLISKEDNENQGTPDACSVGDDVVGLLNTNRSVSALAPNDGNGAAAATNK